MSESLDIPESNGPVYRTSRHSLTIDGRPLFDIVTQTKLDRLGTIGVLPGKPVTVHIIEHMIIRIAGLNRGEWSGKGYESGLLQLETDRIRIRGQAVLEGYTRLGVVTECVYKLDEVTVEGVEDLGE